MGYKLPCEKYHRRSKNPNGKGRDSLIEKGTYMGRVIHQAINADATRVVSYHATRGYSSRRIVA